MPDVRPMPLASRVAAARLYLFRRMGENLHGCHYFMLACILPHISGKNVMETGAAGLSYRVHQT